MPSSTTPSNAASLETAFAQPPQPPQPPQPQPLEAPTRAIRRLVRPRDNRWIGGVCAGIARRYGLRPSTVRLLFVVSCLLPGPQFLIYLMLWLIIPNA